MTEPRRAEDARDEELLEGQAVFKGPRKLRRLVGSWLSRDAEE